jgi:probable rRNA maturation factor
MTARATALLQVDVSRAVRMWTPAPRQIERWAREACGTRGAGRELAVRIVSSAESRQLNGRYRGKDKPTNVLSFAPPAGTAAHLGDVVVCAAVVRREALQQRKPLLAHWAHLIVHGCLHLLGLDHQNKVQARRMERREVATLARLGIGDPYRAPQQP